MFTSKPSSPVIISRRADAESRQHRQSAQGSRAVFSDPDFALPFLVKSFWVFSLSIIAINAFNVIKAWV